MECPCRSPIIWYPPEGYHPNYELPEGQEAVAFAILARHHGLRPTMDKYSPAYSLTALHKNYLFSMRT